MARQKIKLQYFTDVLCIWAYVAQVRLDELQSHFKSQLDTEYHFTALFGDVPTRIGQGWKEKGGYIAFAEHVQHVAEGFPHINVHEDVWRICRPKTSAIAHLLINAAQNLPTVSDQEVEKLIQRIREAFFKEGRDISDVHVLMDIVKDLNLDFEAIWRGHVSGGAFARYSRDNELYHSLNLRGSPTYYLNEGRQLLYGNVGYKLLEANVNELLREPNMQASWC
jgi:predicted DsbA family dithiol-disulfide isomerase